MKNRYAFITMMILLILSTGPVHAQEVVVLSSYAEAIEWLKAENWWGKEKHGQQLQVPRTMIVAISERWRENAPKMEVAVKKEFFYRLLLPLVVHANTMVLERRQRLEKGDATLAAGGTLSDAELAALRQAAILFRVLDRETAEKIKAPDELRQVIQQLLYKLDVIPAGLVLGQAAYESGYGTSRFAVEGNALFGQWAFGGEGLVPEQQRKQLGDHRIASFDWPFDSVRAYFINLSAHPAYEDFRRLRAQLKKAGKPLRSLDLADGLKSYSERGQAYVDTLKGIIRTNRLDIADDAVARDEPLRFIMGAPGPEAAKTLRADIQAMRKSGEFAQIVARMRLE